MQIWLLKRNYPFSVDNFIVGICIWILLSDQSHYFEGSDLKLFISKIHRPCWYSSFHSVPSRLGHQLDKNQFKFKYLLPVLKLNMMIRTNLSLYLMIFKGLSQESPISPNFFWDFQVAKFSVPSLYLPSFANFSLIFQFLKLIEDFCGSLGCSEHVCFRTVL